MSSKRQDVRGSNARKYATDKATAQQMQVLGIAKPQIETQEGTQISTHSSVREGTQESTQNELQTGTKTNAQDGTDRGTQGYTQESNPKDTHASVPGGTQIKTQSDTQEDTPKDTQNETPEGMHEGTNKSTQDSVQKGMLQGTHTGVQGSSSPVAAFDAIFQAKQEERIDRKTFVVRKDLLTRLEALTKKKPRGFQTFFINYILEQALDEAEKGEK